MMCEVCCALLSLTLVRLLLYGVKDRITPSALGLNYGKMERATRHLTHCCL